MNIQTLLPRLRTWFDTYTLQFSSDDLAVQEAINLKIEHTRRVCQGIVDMGLTLDLSEEDLCLAETSALLHDIGRFKQYSRHKTFLDHDSEDHAALGAKIIQSNGILNGLEDSMAELIVLLVSYHNVPLLPVGETERCLFFLKLLRDADKLDILRVLTEHYHNVEHLRRQAIEPCLPSNNEISGAVYEILMSGKSVSVSHIKTMNDFKLFYMGWVYDLNFSVTYQNVLENKFLEKIRDSLPKNSTEVEKIFKLARSYVERHAL